MSARAWSRANQNIEAEILQSGVENFFDIGLQPVNFVNKENLAGAHVAEDARKV